MSNFQLYPLQKPLLLEKLKIPIGSFFETFSHQQTRVSKKLLESQNIVICMTKSHQDFLKRNFRQESYLFNEISYGKKTDIADDVESSIYLRGENSLEVFVKDTVMKIAQAVPYIYKALVVKIS